MSMKSLLILAITIVFSNAQQLSVSLPEAVNINHKLIKDLYMKNEALNLRILELEAKLDGLIGSKVSNKKNNLSKKQEYFVSYEALNVRNNPNIKKSKIIGELVFGDTVNCEYVTYFQDWCKIDNNKYVYKKGLVKVDNKLLLSTKNTNLYTNKFSFLQKEYIEKGLVLSSKGKLNNQWYVLQNNLLIKSDDVIQATKGYINE